MAALTRDTALALLREKTEEYIRENYDGDLDQRGLVLELKQMTNIGQILRWFLDILEADDEDLRILVMLAWVDCLQDDFDGFYPTVET